MRKLPSQWIAELAESLEQKYKAKFNGLNFLDIWCEWWHCDMTDARDFLENLGATETEIKAYLFQVGIAKYDLELINEYRETFM